MKHKIKYIAVILLLYSCSTSEYLLKDFQGTYLQKENTNIHLVFKGNTFAHVDPYTKNDLALYTCCDTITFGNWGIDSRNDLIYLNSSDYLSTSMVDIQVDEKKVNDTDSLYFLINNPIEKYFKKYGGKKRDVYYKIAIDTQSGLLVKLFQQEYDTNFIKIQKPKGSIIEKFTIYIYPKSNFGGRNIGTREVTTLEYQLKDANTNSFEVNIPLLDYGYMSYIRLNKDFVKIISKTKLEWDNHIYSK